MSGQSNDNQSSYCNIFSTKCEFLCQKWVTLSLFSCPTTETPWEPDTYTYYMPPFPILYNSAKFRCRFFNLPLNYMEINWINLKTIYCFFSPCIIIVLYQIIMWSTRTSILDKNMSLPMGSLLPNRQICCMRLPRLVQ